MALSYLDKEVDSRSETRAIEEISIAIAAQDLTPTVMSLDFLKFGGIIPKDWELTKQPILNPNFAQLNFKNGVSITAQPRTIAISEALNGKNIDEIKAAQIAIKYVEKLPHAEYLGLSFGPKILLPFANSPQKPRQFITNTLLNSGSWKDIGRAPMQAGINLMYLLDRCQLTINVSEARLQQPRMQPLSGLLFSGNFNYDIDKAEDVSKTQSIIEIANYWQDDLQSFREIVENKFLVAANDNFGQAVVGESVFPETIL